MRTVELLRRENGSCESSSLFATMRDPSQFSVMRTPTRRPPTKRRNDSLMCAISYSMFLQSFRVLSPKFERVRVELGKLMGREEC